MRRIVFWALSTVTTVVLLFGYHTSTMGASASAPPSLVSGLAPGQDASSPGQTTRRTTRTSTRTPTRTAAPAQTAAPTTGPATGPTTGPTAAPTTAAPAPTTKTVTGPVVGTAYGPVQVALQVQGSTITAVNVLQHPAGNPQSDQINSYALPVLVRETVDRQSANIDMVSGATYTSTGYEQSLQSALDQAGL